MRRHNEIREMDEGLIAPRALRAFIARAKTLGGVSMGMNETPFNPSGVVTEHDEVMGMVTNMAPEKLGFLSPALVGEYAKVDPLLTHRSAKSIEDSLSMVFNGRAKIERHGSKPLETATHHEYTIISLSNGRKLLRPKTYSYLDEAGNEQHVTITYTASGEISAIHNIWNGRLCGMRHYKYNQSGYRIAEMGKEFDRQGNVVREERTRLVFEDNHHDVPAAYDLRTTSPLRPVVALGEVTGKVSEPPTTLSPTHFKNGNSGLPPLPVHTCNTGLLLVDPQFVAVPDFPEGIRNDDRTIFASKWQLLLELKSLHDVVENGFFDKASEVFRKDLKAVLDKS